MRVCNGALRYTEGHLSRISGDALKAKGDAEGAQARVRRCDHRVPRGRAAPPSWPDPFIGLSRTFVAGLGDVDRGADALAQARRLGYTPASARPRSWRAATWIGATRCGRARATCAACRRSAIT